MKPNPKVNSSKGSQVASYAKFISYYNSEVSHRYLNHLLTFTCEMQVKEGSYLHIWIHMPSVYIIMVKAWSGWY